MDQHHAGDDQLGFVTDNLRWIAQLDATIDSVEKADDRPSNQHSEQERQINVQRINSQKMRVKDSGKNIHPQQVGDGQGQGRQHQVMGKAAQPQQF